MSVRTISRLLLIFLAIAIATGCNRKTPASDAKDPPASKGEAMNFQITSSAFQHNSTIPKKYTGEGLNISPPMAWRGAPAATKGFALLVDDPDAPTVTPWVHWVIYNIPANVTELTENIPKQAEIQNPPARQGLNTSGKVGYTGPMPPVGHGMHHYYFKLYALDADLDLPERLQKEELLKAIKDHILQQTELIGTYQRN